METKRVPRFFPPLELTLNALPCKDEGNYEMSHPYMDMFGLCKARVDSTNKRLLKEKNISLQTICKGQLHHADHLPGS